jgi:hypothetical protein
MNTLANNRNNLPVISFMSKPTNDEVLSKLRGHYARAGKGTQDQNHRPFHRLQGQ